MHVAHLALSIPLAVGELENQETTGKGGVGIGIISVASIAVGYVALFALWWFVFRDKRRSKRKKDPPS